MDEKKCKEWRSNQTLNPLTRRVIKINGPVYKKLQKECNEIRPANAKPVNNERGPLTIRQNNARPVNVRPVNARPVNNERDVIESDCKKWVKNKHINPQTGRRIIYKGPTYNSLQKKCLKYLKYSTSVAISTTSETTSTKTANAITSTSDSSSSDSSSNVIDNIDTFGTVELTDYDVPAITKNGPPESDISSNSSYARPELRVVDDLDITEDDTDFDMDDMATYLEERHHILPRVQRDISLLNTNVWNMCLSKPHSKFRKALKNVRHIGAGTFGMVYRGDFNGSDIVMKEAYIRKEEMKNIKYRKSGGITKASYSDEYKTLLLINDLLETRMSPNFLFVYDLVLCDTCLIRGKVGKCFNTIMEPADGDLKHLSFEPSDAQDRSMLYQMLLGVTAMHKKFGIYHRDIKRLNTLFKVIPSGGYLQYIVDDYVFYVKNNGVLLFISDFGVSNVFSPKYGNKEYYGHRNVYVNDKGLLEPIRCDGNHIINWITGMFGTFNRITQLNNKCNVDLDIYDMQRFPPQEFFNDIQDVLRMFYGGRKTVQPGYHPGMDISPHLKCTLQPFILKEFPYHKKSAKFLLAQEMLANIYESPGDISPDEIIDTFVI